MCMNLEERLHQSVQEFRKCAYKVFPGWNELNDNGEWELEMDEFYIMCDFIMEVIEKTRPEEASEQMHDDILFGIARDNECSDIIYKLLEYPEWYSFLFRKSLATGYIYAKMQFAEELKDYTGQDGLREIVLDFLNNSDGYTECLALESLAYIHPDQAEKYAIELWWDDKYEAQYGTEYYKIMALYVLYIIDSAELERYLDLAESSGDYYLEENAKALRKKLSERQE